MIGYYQPYWSDELEHFGVLGMKWGVRRYQNKDGTLTQEGRKRLGYKNLKNAKTSNFEKWGKSEDTNTLWVTGYGGSGKSTVALAIKRKNDKVIHLDLYSDEVSSGAGNRDKDFDAYLDRNAPNCKKIPTMKFGTKKYWKTVDELSNAIDQYSKEQYKQGNRVIVEEIQIAQNWLRSGYDSYKGQPITVIDTSRAGSLIQAFTRDQRSDPAIAHNNPSKGAFDAAETVTGIRLEKLPGTAKEMEPVWDYAYNQVSEVMFGSINDKQRAAMVAYGLLVQAGIEGFFDVRFESNNGKERVVFIHTKTGTICRTINEAKVCVKSIGRQSREKNVQGKAVSVTVNKNK